MKLSGHVKPSNINRRTIRIDYLESFKHMIGDGDIYQFGVYSGVSLENILSAYKKLNKLCKVWGFDSFCGLPKELLDPKNKLHPVWSEGEFSSCDYFDVDDPSLAAKIIQINLSIDFPEFDIEMVKGFFKDSLKLEERYKPASYIDIDVDIYTSTVEVLEFLYQNKILQNGTLVYYDDWKDETYGEGRAHIEFCNKYNVKFKTLIGYNEQLMIVEEINYA